MFILQNTGDSAALINYTSRGILNKPNTFTVQAAERLKDRVSGDEIIQNIVIKN
jgi:hypothetical protein